MNTADDLRVQTFAGHDTVQVNGITGPTLIDTGAGDDVVHVSAQTAGTPGDPMDPPDYVNELVVETGAGSNILTVDQLASAAGDGFVITDQRISSGLIPGVNYRASGGGSFATIAVYGTSHDDTFQIHSTAASADEMTIVGLNGNDAFEVGVENGSLADIASPLTLTAGSGGSSTAVLSDRAAGSGNADVLLSGSMISGLAGPLDNVPVRVASAGGALAVIIEGTDNAAVAERFTLDGFLRPLSIEGGAGNERFEVLETTTKASLLGGAGDDVYDVGNDIALLGATVTIADTAGKNVIDVDDSAAPDGRIYQLKASGLRRVGTAFDQLNLKSARGTLNILATAGSDQFRALGAPLGLSVNVDLDRGSNVLVGPSAPTRWDVVGVNHVRLGKLGQFRNAAHLVGGANNDQFTFAKVGKITGMLMGGTGVDTLDYSAWTAAVSVDLAASSASAVGGSVFNIENVVGGRGSDVLLGGVGANQLNGGGGNDLILGRAGNDVLFGGAGYDILIGNTGGDRLFGGDGEDILIGGDTIHDADLAALRGILSTWTNSEMDYKSRVTELRGSSLDAASVSDDGAVDLLRGQRDLDWFRASGGDSTDRVLGETLG
jgi:Ca2+-binding RTX toxin-like protein